MLRNIYDHVGAPWTVCVTPGPHQYLYSSNSNPDNNDSRVTAVTGEVYKMELDGTVVGKFGQPGKGLKDFTTIHEIDCKTDNDLVVGEIDGSRAAHPAAPGDSNAELEIDSTRGERFQASLNLFRRLQ